MVLAETKGIRMSATHTPSPWVHHKDSPTDVITAPYAPHAPSIATIDIGPSDREEIAANARLIAAAPDLLAALQTLLMWPNYEAVTNPDYVAAKERAEAVVANATGAA
jgi:hypothetical protein